MALRAFHANPCIGGFGGENTPPSLLRPNNRGSCSGSGGQSQRQGGSSPRTGGNSGDAFCQIVKELVDNAVDAVNTSLQHDEQSEEWDKQKRIRVEIKPYTQQRNERANSSNDASPFDESSDLLKIEVLDNGCGMDNIQNCVNAFHSTKANSQSQGSGGGEEGGHSNTSGRYGIGLTLCLLHAQRLVPNSYACITSTKKGMDHHSRALFVVDSQHDAVVCHAEEQIPKQDDLNPSGTSVALLIPGTSAHSLAWERLVAYFSRFRLCPNLMFGLEVLAPTLERIPIFIRPKPLKQLPSNLTNKTRKADNAKSAAGTSQGNPSPQDDPLDISSWHELNADQDEGEDNHSDLDSKDDDSDSIPSVLFSKSEPRRQEVLDTAKEYWRDRKMALKNTAVSNQRIRANENQRSATHDTSLELEVNMIVCPLPSRNAPDESYEEFDNEEHSYSSQQHQHSSKEDEPAAIELVRMVNDVPILDGAEAHSCGLVHGLADKTVWGSFGLDISRKATHEPNGNAILPSTGCKWTPTFELQDDCRVGAFIQRDSNHKQLHSLVEDEWNASDSEDEDFDDGKSQDSEARKRSALRQMDDLLPAGVRLHSILIVVRIRAAPSSLPLPTLSKGRLPLNHALINDALHRGLNECLSSLQRTNPLLLLSPNQLSSVVRDVRYIPKLAKEMALSMCQTNNPVFRERARAILKMASEMDAAATGNARSQASFNSAATASDQNLDPSHLSDATRKILSFKVQARLEALQEAKKREKKEAKAAKALKNMLDDEDLEEIGCGSGGTDTPAKKNSSQSSINDQREGRLVRGQSSGGLSTSSWKEVGEESSTSSDSSPAKVESDMSACPTAPLKAINASMSHSGVPIEESDDNFDDDWM